MAKKDAWVLLRGMNIAHVGDSQSYRRQTDFISESFLDFQSDQACLLLDKQQR
jgi:hypothetical protein